LAAPETKVSLEQARSSIERAEALGESPEDPLILFSILYGFWAANHNAFNGDICCDLAAQFLALAEKQGTAIPLMMGHRIMGRSLLDTGRIVEGRTHCDQAIGLYNPTEHRSLAMRFVGLETGVAIRSFRSLSLWLLGYPEAALADAALAIEDARQFGQAATLMFALNHVILTNMHCGYYAAANAQTDEAVALATEKASVWNQSIGMMTKGSVLTLSGEASKAIPLITSGIAGWRSTGAKLWIPHYLSYLTRAYAELDQFDDAWRSIDEAMSFSEITKERWCQADMHRIAGEIALMSPARNGVKAETYFDRALAVAREQQAKSWELRAAMSMARLWCDQGKRQQAHDLLAPVHGWFTEGFDTLDLKEAKALLEELR
jgi:predicted ATPase